MLYHNNTVACFYKGLLSQSVHNSLRKYKRDILFFLASCQSLSTLRYTSGTIRGPGYPGKYPNNAVYCWRIYVPQYYVVKLNINYLYMESCSGCSCDSVEVFDGYSVLSSSLGKYCSRSWRVTSSGQYLFVKFTSDASGTGTAFSASYYRVVRGKGKVS